MICIQFDIIYLIRLPSTNHPDLHQSHLPSLTHSSCSRRKNKLFFNIVMKEIIHDSRSVYTSLVVLIIIQGLDTLRFICGVYDIESLPKRAKFIRETGQGENRSSEIYGRGYMMLRSK